MTDRVDYKFNEQWDIEFTDWNDFKVAHDTDVLMQNFVLLAAENTNNLIGEQITATKLSRFRRRLEGRFRERESVNNFFIRQINVDDRTLEYDIVVGSDEFTGKIRV